MADLTITAADVSPVRVISQWTGYAHEAVAAGNAGYMVVASGKFGLADANAAAPVNEPKGVFTKGALQLNDEVTLITEGWINVGDALDALDYGDPVFLSNTAGALADADEGAGILIGEVWPAFGAAPADKILYVKPRTLADVAPGSITGSMLAGGFLNVALVAGSTAGDHAVTGIASGDEIVFVGHLSTAAAIATLGDLTSEFSVTAADTINNAAGTDTTSDQLMVIWMDLT